MPQINQDLLLNLIPHLETWWGVLEVIVAAIGLFLVVSGLVGLSGRQDGGKKRALLTLIAGTLMLNAPSLLDAFAQTLFTQNSAEVLSYHPPDSNPASGYIRLAVLAVALTGLIGVARGLYLMRLSPGEGGGLARALVHMTGGVICVNLVEFLKLLAASLGGDVEILVTSILG
ncbi:MAG: hypothetical protein LBT62_02045 [Deltaproteobacteria bacterium]|jgi:hypothetical protein|nr:hypothetical protein [Deltaproteobacteria bacterium]